MQLGRPKRLNALHVVIPYCQKDEDLVRILLQWIETINKQDNVIHPLLFVVDSKVRKGVRNEFIKMAERVFSFVEEIEFVEPPHPGPELRYPIWRYWANQMFLTASKHIFENCRLPWLWLEPDAVPMHGGWLDELSFAYYSQPKRFMGSITRRSGELPPNIPKENLAGVAVYPVSAYRMLAKWCGPGHCWDLAGAADVLPMTTKTRLIQHTYGISEQAGWVFKKDRAEDDPPEVIEPFSLVGKMQIPREDCVLFHRSKDASLLDLLNQEFQKAKKNVGLKRGKRAPLNGHTKMPEWKSPEPIRSTKVSGQEIPKTPPLRDGILQPLESTYP